MAAFSSRYVFTIEGGTRTLQSLANAHSDKAKTCQGIINLWTGLDAGNWQGGRVEVHSGPGTGGGVAASQTVTYVGSTGPQSITVESVVLNFTAGATDILTVQNAIAAIRAGGGVSAFFGMVFIPLAPVYGATINTANILTLWANTVPRANTLGNGATFSVTGTGATAGGATFSGGVNAPANGFTV